MKSGKSGPRPQASGPGSRAAADVSREGEDEIRLRLLLHYDGRRFFGWQVQKRERTVQGELLGVVRRLTGRPPRIVGAGRTDRGVHATGQVAAVTVPGRWTAESFRRALNALLPPDIWVRGCARAPLAFDPRRDAAWRSYEYRVGLTEEARSPFVQPWCWPVADEVDLAALEAAAASIRGDRCFGSFARSGQPERGTRCVVERSKWSDWDGMGLLFTITANRYLHRMVRYLVGTMIDVGRGRRPLEDMHALLEPGSSSAVTSPPAPPEGLFLRHVHYPDEAPHLESPNPSREEREERMYRP